MKRIILNGEIMETEATTLQEMLLSLQVEEQCVIVEHNGVIVPKAELASKPICENDAVELITLVGGG